MDWVQAVHGRKGTALLQNCPPEIGSGSINNWIGLLVVVFVVDELLSEATGMKPTWRWILEGD
jgi:hypothetical protein